MPKLVPRLIVSILDIGWHIEVKVFYDCVVDDLNVNGFTTGSHFGNDRWCMLPQ